jgi:hypothetical protein
MSFRSRGRHLNRSTVTWTPLSVGGTTATLDIDFVTGHAYNSGTAAISSLLTCTRASTGYYTDANGHLSSFGNNVLRYGNNGLLVEESRTNDTFPSQSTFATLGNQGLNGTNSSSTTAAPDGTLTADLWVPSVTSTQHEYTNQATTSAQGGSALGCYVKAAGYTRVGLRETASSGAYAVFTLIGAGSVFTSGGTGFGAARITALANGWYWIWFNETNAAQTKRLGILPLDANYVSGDPKSYNFSGDGISGIIIWGHQIELGAFATSYIPTTSSTATRAADSVSTTVPSMIFPTGTVFMDYTSNAANPSARLWSMYKLGVDKYDVNIPAFSVQIDGAGYNPVLPEAGGTRYKTALACVSGTQNFAANGTLGTAGALTASTVPDTLYIGSQGGTSQSLNAYTRRFAWWNTALSTGNLQTLTSFTAAELFAMSALDINFVANAATQSGNGASIASLLTCTRASTGYYTDASGNLSSFGNNALRMGNNGLLVEESRTNLLLQSQFVGVSWGANDSTLTASAGVAPDGTSTAATLIDTVSNAQHFANQTSGALSNTTAYTVSFYAKPDGRSIAALDLNGAGLSFIDTYFTLTGSGASNPGAGITATIAQLANGWYRCAATFTSSAASALTVTIATSIATNGFTYAGDGVSGLFIWGAQLEAGAFATSYIPTTSSTATRAADVISFTAGDSPSWIAATSTYYAKATLLNAAVDGNNPRLWGTGSDASSTINTGNSNTAASSYNGSSLLTGNAGAGTWSAGAQAAFAGDATHRAICMNAGTVGTDANTAGLQDKIRIGSDRGITAFANGYIKRTSYWNSRLSNANLQTLTT